MFVDEIRKEIDRKYNTTFTENGAVAYRTTGKSLLDLNFAVASLREASKSEIVRRFASAFAENNVLAVKWLFYVRDVREGLGERRLFRVALNELKNTNVDLTKLVPLVSEYGRWDDLWCLLDNEEDDSEIALSVFHLVEKQLEEDLRAYSKGKPISLLAKWLPSVNASSKKTKELARRFVKALGYTDKTYRQTLSKLRAYSNVVEVKMCAKEWNNIDYEAVPSKANLLYNNAFLRNDENRRRAYLDSLEKGEVKINASVLYPHDIVHKYGASAYMLKANKYDATLEALWKALPSNNIENTLVVADGSGSMCARVGGTDVSALEVANALAIYFAQHNKGEFKDKYITFSETPKFVNLTGNTLRDNLVIASSHNEVANTNIEAVFDLILSAAVRGKISQSEMPSNILIISDMEFDSCAVCNYEVLWGRRTPLDAKLFEVIKQRYEDNGYQIPRLVFWNVNSRTGAIPVKENAAGVALVSGFSTNVAKMVMSGKTDPFECLLETLNSERYDAVEEALKG